MQPELFPLAKKTTVIVFQLAGVQDSSPVSHVT